MSMFSIILMTIALICVGKVIYEHHNKRTQNTDSVEDVPTSTSSGQKSVLGKDEIERSLDCFNLWINNCDQKASVLLAIVGVVTTLFFTSDAIKMFREYIFQPIAVGIQDSDKVDFCPSRFCVLVLFIATASLLLVTLAFLIRVISPNLDYNKMRKDNPEMEPKTILFFMSVASMSYHDYKSAAVNYLNDLQSQAYTNAKIATIKFTNFSHAVFYFVMTVITASMLFVAVMFMI